MKNALIFSEKKFASAPRIAREIHSLKEHFNLFLSGTDTQHELEQYTCIYDLLSTTDKLRNRINQLLKRKAVPSFSRLEQFVKQNQIELIIIHEAKFLPLITKIKAKYPVKLVFNAHEYHPLEFEDLPGWLETEGANYSRLYRQYLGKIDLFINVCESIREKCLAEFGVDSIVIPNATSFKDLDIQTSETQVIRLIHHGANLPSRKIEKMIEIAAELGDAYSLDLMLTSVQGCESYDAVIQKRIAETPNVSRKAPVKMEAIAETIGSYDIGLFYLEPSNFNYRYALPNKLFEFIQARLTIAVSPSPEMKNLVEKYDLGVVADTFSVESMSEQIRKLTAEDIRRFKQNSHQTASLENAEKYDLVYSDKVLSLFNN